MAKFKKQYKILINKSRTKLESLVYFEINHEGWELAGGPFFVSETHAFDASSPLSIKQVENWCQGLVLNEPFWKTEPVVLNEEILGTNFDASPERPKGPIEREEEEPEIFRDD